MPPVGKSKSRIASLLLVAFSALDTRSSSSVVRQHAESGRHLGQVRHEGFAMSRHAPDGSEQLAHRRDHGYLLLRSVDRLVDCFRHLRYEHDGHGRAIVGNRRLVPSHRG